MLFPADSSRSSHPEQLTELTEADGRMGVRQLFFVMMKRERKYNRNL
ncbi:MAG: hypothetical protein KC649_03240 [Candidatus Omnitrophica bacterium]|nr:hypothetical protein [Candidatus Omnitrophota bacterium]